ncbi:MAG: ATP-binding protein [Kangiellaceae bacterium]|nr:ATP-binding protein [Kangiellaceae bacterium]
MIKKILLPIILLIVANLCAFMVLYYVYFPWMASIDSEEVKEEILTDVRELNFRLSVLDYNHSPQTIARAEYELETDITNETFDQLLLDKDSKKELKENRYLVYMDGDNGPTGHVILNDNQTVLTLGPYPADYNDIMVKDWFVYAFILLLANGAIVISLYQYMQRSLRPATFALDKVSFEGLSLERQEVSVEDLSSNVPKLIEHINKLSKEHRQSLYNQRDLMHAVAHEFRSPMARMSFALDLFNENTTESRREKLKQDMHDALDELDSLVREVLGYSRLKDGQHPLQLEYFNIKDVADEVCAKVKAIHVDKQFLIYSQPSKGLEIFADRNLIERALINLVRNAARFSISTVQISLNKYSDSLDIKVEDDGPGIPPGKRERIFEPFTRLDFSRNRDSGGAGLGLAIVKGIVNRHNGKIWAEDSRLLNGALFTIHIPIAQAESLAEEKISDKVSDEEDLHLS